MTHQCRLTASALRAFIGPISSTYGRLDCGIALLARGSGHLAGKNYQIRSIVETKHVTRKMTVTINPATKNRMVVYLHPDLSKYLAKG